MNVYILIMEFKANKKFLRAQRTRLLIIIRYHSSGLHFFVLQYANFYTRSGPRVIAYQKAQKAAHFGTLLGRCNGVLCAD